MKWTVLVAALLLSASIVGANTTDGDCPDGWSAHGSRCYKFFFEAPEGLTFEQAQARCGGENARVAEPRDQSINDFIVNMRNSDDTHKHIPAWIGLQDDGVEGVHRWTSDDVLLGSYNNWATNPAEPNDSPGEADCTRIHQDDPANPGVSNQWRDYPCDSQSFGVICETLSPCEVDRGTCSASGDPHYTTLDKRRHHFQGPCKYTFAKDCANEDFTVEAQNVPLPARPWVSVTREVCVRACDIHITILQGKVVKVNNNGTGQVTTTLPYYEPGGRIEVTLVGKYVRVRLIDSCVEVFFDGSHRLRVEVPTTYMGNMCGLCGDFNGDPNDDLQGLSTTVFGNTHLTDISTCPGGDPGPTDDPPTSCDDALTAEVSAIDKCGMLTDPGGPFAICHNIVDPQDFFDNCVFDMCAWEGADGLCQNLEDYADTCAEHGVPPISWRTTDFCPLQCPANSVYQSCTSPCPATCRDQSAHCTDDCVEGCECVTDHVWSGQSCVPVNQCGCFDEETGQYYELNAQWGTADGRECVCTEGGIIECVQVNCDEDGGYSWTLVDGVWGCHCVGACCERSICYASGDPHYCTPDGRRHHFQGPCRYTFAKDCIGNDFTVETKNVPSPRRPSVSLVRSVYVIVVCDGQLWVICILQRRVVQVNGVIRTVPLSLANGEIDIKLTGRFIRIELVKLCVVIYYDGRHHVKVEIPSNYQNQLCGLCGNFNGVKGDDFVMSDGTQAANWNQFGNSWLTDPDTCDGDIPTGEPPTLGPCDEYEAECAVLMDAGGPFASCHDILDPQPYFDDCVFDMCSTMGEYLCANLEVYYDTCMAAGGAPFAWRSMDLCPMECGEHSSYSHCTSACPATCVNPSAPDNCDLPCVEGCECDEGYMQSGLECVPQSNCGCLDIFENYYTLGEQWGTEDGQECECGHLSPLIPIARITCTPVTCYEEGGYAWMLVDGVWGCHCNDSCCDRAICYAWGDPHYCTPDGRTFNYQGSCRYTFAKDCGNNDFTVEVQQIPWERRPSRSVVRTVYVIAYGFEIEIGQGRYVRVNAPPPGFSAVLPITLAGGKIVITLSGGFVRVELTDLCVVILYDGRTRIEVEIPSNYKGVLCGLCGNYNGMSGDDFMKPGYMLTSSVNEFGNSWATDIATCEVDPPTGDPPTLGPCAPMYSDQCDVLTDPMGPFADCHGYVDPMLYHETCVYDICSTEGGVLCANLETYYAACLRAGSPSFTWRSPDLCPMECPDNSAYSACTSPCPATCVDPNAPDNCFIEHCMEGCECDAGYIQSGLGCVLPADCGCTDEDGYYHTLGEIWEDDGEECECFPGGMIECEEIDGCDPNPCDANAQCEDNPAPDTGATCTCNVGYTGDGVTCTDVDECGTNNGGCEQTCTNTMGSYVCSCDTGYTLNADGHSCDDVDECNTNNGGCAQTCTNTVGSYYCTCGDGYTLNVNGHSCDDVNECDTNNGNCEQNCMNTVGSYYCTCDAGYTLNVDGHSCDDVDECLTNNGGCGQTCTNTVGSYDCSCGDGYTLNDDGQSCDDVNECDTDNGGCDHTCTNTVGSYYCTCDAGYTLNVDGHACDDVDECLTNNGGCGQTCTNTEGSYDCSCSNGYTLNVDGQSCDDDNECLTDNGGCDDTCTNTMGSYMCSCDNGYVLNDDGHSCDDVDECNMYNGGCGQTCTNTMGSYDCSCDTGYTLNADGHSCDDVDECLTDNGGCDDTCANTVGSYDCSCDDGYSLNDDGHSCDDVDECATNNGGCEHTCSNTMGSYDCSCDTGYTLNDDGHSCDDVDECDTDNGGCDHTCSNTDGSYDCSCDAGYSLNADGHACDDVDECNTDNGGCEHTCSNTMGGYDCSCDTGYTLNDDGHSCDDVDECGTDNGGCGQTCTNTPGSYDCSCSTGYTLNDDGHSCDDTNGCVPDPCVGMAFCTDNAAPMTGASCTCPAGYHGDGKVHGTGCTDIAGCTPNPCHPLATCEDVPAPDTGAVCTCPAGFEGDGTMGGTGCTEIDGCEPDVNPCDANAQCKDNPPPDSGATCTCNDGYDGNGVTCTDEDECDSNNGGCEHTCKNTPGSYYCSCYDGYTLNADLHSCDDVDECDTDNGGCDHTCSNTDGSYDCSCDAGYTLNADGHACDDVDECDDMYNGGCGQTCTNTMGSYDCSCGDGYTLNDDGHSCDDVDECDDMYNGGCGQTCTNTIGSYDCSCGDGYTLNDDGHSCDDVDECDDMYNGGCGQTCTNTIGSYDCSCGDGYTLNDDGHSCDDVDECDDMYNGGCGQTCTNTMGGYDCSCGDGYTLNDDGHSCDDIDGCDPNPCVQMATCEDLPPPDTGAICHCPAKYGGDGFMTGTGCTPLTRDGLCELPGRGICRSCGDPHTKQFDKGRHHFQGPCRYIFAKDCGYPSDFTVEVQHVPVPRRPVVSVVRAVFVIAHGYEVGIHQGNIVTVNGPQRTVPFQLAGGKIRVRFRGIWIHVRLTEFCVDIFYNGRHCVKVKVTPYYWGRMCGLCGNYNGDKGDDFMMSDMMTIATNWNDFGYSWLVEDEDNEKCIGPPPPPPCPYGLMTVVSSNDMCGIITNPTGPFAACHAVVDPADFFDDCVFDMCARDGDIVGLCENLEAYADACEDAGVTITWRTAKLCPLPCPPNSHYNPCASPCPPTCQEPNPVCITLCVECCECDDGYIMSGQHCVPVEKCGCTDPMTGQYYELDETWVDDGRRCVCREDNRIICKRCSFDIVFILDRSSSIGPYGMFIAEKYIAHIIKCLYGLDVDVGYIVFDCISKWLISLGLYNVDTSGLIPKIKAADFTGGESRAGNAIRYMKATADYRNGIPSAAVVLTDGRAYIENPANLYEIQADAARAMGIELYAVAVGRPYFFNYAALAYIAGGWDRVFDRFSCCDLAVRLLEDLCVACDVSSDLFFVLDGSGSVGDDNFEKIQQFVVDVVGAFTISLTDTRVGVVQYSSSSDLACNLGDHPDVSSFVTAINTMTYQYGSSTYTGEAMEFARQNAAWRLAPVPRIMIVLTDGKSWDNVVPAAQALAADGVKVYAIGVGNYDAAELLDIANGDTDCRFELDDFDALKDSINMIVKAVCLDDATCHQPADPGLCKAYFPRWYFNSQSGQCEQFIYGGCGGNDNNFATLAECVSTCGTPCPPGVDMVECFADPCDNAECPANPDATCRANYCGGCNAVFYDAQGNEVMCIYPI
ncbi:IgGFc-binding protein-like [Branchiostoma lanceolatum]|uniref:IgGFc-binding protein-like n=1 Tax=Branchiostoma lanceolatum TaxID=7740 RepID=UPI0034520C9D